ncbi:4a-hydroxytetrahydrobiopterin dehydratase [Catenuloplanes nepalensis]|uniref:Putative pterin-4-alpha-carbinolamine dehydratase n=1 Tax=Catenuloplanes nepalensis TaxID=587533 RepID=A0ABT9N1H1_9ACTN|nr:4a-hydroxytetrahydrobiopterin dehydratase [Catenuloplanes nepalensis]MDP9797537.1 4a-hydroxytetrahydrobiopterin dehydratase [Catenuloplanes nepalensis]
MAQLLDDAAVGKALAQLTGWIGDQEVIVRTVEFPSFPAAIVAVVDIAKIAEELEHHPDIDIRWRTVTFRLTTHSDGGVTERDITLATRIDEIVASVLSQP